VSNLEKRGTGNYFGNSCGIIRIAAASKARGADFESCLCLFGNLVCQMRLISKRSGED
jgi:hypothetical protein